MTAPTRRKAPAFQIFASDDLASPAWFSLSIGERGLLDSMRRVAWVSPDGRIPRDPDDLALLIRRSVAEVKRYLTRDVLDHFERCEDVEFLFDPELERQREKTAAFRAARAKGAEVTNEKRRAQSASLSEAPSAALSVTLSGALPDMKRDDMKGKATTASFRDYLHVEESAAARFPPIEGD